MVNKGRPIDVLLVVSVLFVFMEHACVAAAPMGTAFTYQGRFNVSGNPATGAYDFEFKLFDAATAGNQVGSTVTKLDLNVSDGYFTTTLDFGSSPFAGDSRWLQIAARPGAETGAYTTLTPRHELTPTPYALYSDNLGTANYIPKITSNGLANSVVYESNGKIGIGITSPSQPLAVAGTYSGGNPVTVAKFGTAGFGGTAGDRVDVLLGNIAGGDFGRINIYAPGSGDMAMNLGVWNGTSVVDMVTLKKNGNVGVGLTGPSSKLEVAGTPNNFVIVASASLSGGNFTGFGINGYTAGQPAIKSAFVKERTLSYGVGKIHILNNVTTNAINADLGDARMTIDTNGNVGIATTDPSAGKLVVNGSAAGGTPNIVSTGDVVLGGNGAGIFFDNLHVYSNGNYIMPVGYGTQGYFTSGAERMRITSGGNTGVGTAAPSEKLDVSGNVRCLAVIQTSDEQLKTDIQPLSGVLDKLNGVRAVSFRWNVKAQSLGATADARQIGVLAQELEQVFPELVSMPKPVTADELTKDYPEEALTPQVQQRLQRDAEGTQYKGVNYSQLTAVLLEAVKELQVQNRSLEQRIQTLESRVQ